MNKWILGFKVISESTVRQWLVVCDLRLQVLGDSPQVGWATPSGHHTSIPIPLWKLTLNLPVFIWKSQSLIPTSSSLFSAAHYHHNAKYCLETDPALHFSSTFQTFYCVFRNGCTILSESHYIFMFSVFLVPPSLNWNLIAPWRYHSYMPQCQLLLVYASLISFLLSILPLPDYYFRHLLLWYYLLACW